MFHLNNEWLESLGLAELPAIRKSELLVHAYDTLSMRVGKRLAESMTKAELDEFEGYIDRDDDAGALRWLQTNFPQYKEIVAEGLAALTEEIRTVADKILAAG